MRVMVSTVHVLGEGGYGDAAAAGKGGGVQSPPANRGHQGGCHCQQNIVFPLYGNNIKLFFFNEGLQSIVFHGIPIRVSHSLGFQFLIIW